MASATVSHEQIAKRAFELYHARGDKPGHDLDDWLQAESELIKKDSSRSAESYGSKSAASYQAKPRRQTQSSMS
jgi:hypothetical protein